MTSPKRVLITGAASGLGLACARRFHAAGNHVLGLDRSLCPDDALFAAFARADVTQPQEIDQALASLGIPDAGLAVLVHCAGMSQYGTVTDLDVKAWETVLAVNLTSTFLLARAVIPVMKASGGGAIVTIGSTFGMLARDSMSGYAVSKAGVAHLTRCIAIDYAADNIRANCLCPGLIDTPMTSHLNTTGREAVRDALVDAHPMKRAGTAEDVAETVAFLTSDAACYITGQVLGIDGGFTAGKQVLPRSSPASGH